MTQGQPPVEHPSQDEEQALPFNVRSQEFFQEMTWWSASFVFHALLMSLLMLISTTTRLAVVDDAPSFEAAQAEEEQELAKGTFENFEVGETPLDGAELNADTLAMHQAPRATTLTASEAVGTAVDVPRGLGLGADMSTTGAGVPTRAAIGGLGGFAGFKSLGSGVGPIGVGSSKGVIGDLGSAGGESRAAFFGARGAEVRKVMLGGFGGTKQSERSVAASLNWIARHQNRDGSWSFDGYHWHCKDATCSGAGWLKADVAATALALLPFLAAGQTHQSRGPYRATIYHGLMYLLRTQKSDGSLWGNSSQKMYTHGMATITLCEAYGLTGDKTVGAAAQAAINFIQSAQHPRTGGWRYNPGDEGDTSVVGWIGMALKSGRVVGLKVSDATLQGVNRWLSLCAAGNQRGLCSFTPGSGPSPSMTAVGLLLQQYSGLTPDNPAMKEGVGYIMSQLPDRGRRSLYYWYYASQVMHNMPGADWDRWNRAMRRVLIESQVKEGCASGSWDPARPTSELLTWQCGRLCVTSLSALTLEVYYRYLPLYKLDSESALQQAMAAAPKPNTAKPIATDSSATPPAGETKPKSQPKEGASK